MSTQNVSSVVSNWLCTGCGACEFLCPKGAISLDETVGGYLFPTIDTLKCINCGLCLRTCPGINLSSNILEQLPEDPFAGTCLGSHIGKAVDPQTLAEGQSGGVVTALLQCAFDQGIIDAALTVTMLFGNPPRPYTQLAESKKDLIRTQKSKYAPVPLLRALRKLHSSSCRKVGIIGLPCHIQGLQNILNETTSFPNFHFLTIGLFCDRVMTTRAIDFLAQKSGCPNGQEYLLNFRDKSRGGYPGNVSFQTRDRWNAVLPASNRMEIKDLFTLARCRICFDKMNILSDIAVGDPWGIEDFDKTTGESVAVVRTERGNKLFQLACSQGYISMRKVPYNSILKGQHIPEKEKEWKAYCLSWEKLGFRLPQYYSQIEADENIANSRYLQNLQESVALDSFASVTELLACKRKQVARRRFLLKLKFICLKAPRWITKKILRLASPKGR